MSTCADSRAVTVVAQPDMSRARAMNLMAGPPEARQSLDRHDAELLVDVSARRPVNLRRTSHEIPGSCSAHLRLCDDHHSA